MYSYIIENDVLLEHMLDSFLTEANVTNNNSKAALKNTLTGIARDVSSDGSSKRANSIIEGKRRNLANISLRNEQIVKQTLGNQVSSYVEGECVKAGEKLGKRKGGKTSYIKAFQTEVATIFKNTNIKIEELRKLSQDTTAVLGKQVTNNTAKENEESIEDKKRLIQEGYVECDNFIYTADSLLVEGDYQSNAKKTFKATILTVLVFIISLVLTNMIRTYFGGTPGGDFASSAMKAGFLWFTTLILAPILEEPAKLISVKGGYNKHFFFMFNFLEFGLYVMMMVSGGVSLGVAVLIRSIAVLLHAITNRVLASTKGRGIVNTTFKLAISILLHFIFAALFMKYTVFGIAGNSLLLFVIGFFAAAFGLFVVSKLFKPKNNYQSYFTTTGNLEPTGSYGYA